MGFIIKKRLLLIEKRIILLFLMIFLGLLISYGTVPGTSRNNPQSDRENIAYLSAVSKIKEGSNFRPQGWGSGEYLKTIPTIYAGAVLDDDSGNVLWSMNLKQRIAPASLTKLATVITAFDIAEPRHKLTVSKDASEQIPTKLGLVTGEKLMLSEAASAAIMTSANDAAETISDSLGDEIGDGTSTFMDLVNKKLAKLGAVDSHFVTATGLDDPNHYSTVYDLAILAHEAKNYPDIFKAASSDYLKLAANSDHRLFDLPNWNALLDTYPGVNGLKIGYTEDSGHSTIVTASREGKNLMAIVIGAKSLEEREMAAATLLNYGFDKEGIRPYPLTNINLVKRFDDWKKQLAGKADEKEVSNNQGESKPVVRGKTPVQPSYGGNTPKIPLPKKR